MLTWFKTLILPPSPLGAPRLLDLFGTEAAAAKEGLIPVAPGEWRLERGEPGTTPFFELRNQNLDNCLLTCRAEMRSEGLHHPACLELSCHFPAKAPVLTRGWHHRLTGNQDWEYFEITQHLRRGRAPELIRLSLSTEGPGTIWIRNVKAFVTATM